MEITPRKLRNYLFGSVIVFFILTIVLSVVQPNKAVHALPSGLHSPILALELAFTPQEIIGILGEFDTLVGQSARSGFFLGTHIDTFYIIAYFLSYFLLTVLMVYRQNASRWWIFSSLAILLLTAVADLLENNALFQILLTPGEALLETPLEHLIVFTRLKWIALGISGIIPAILLRREGRKGPSFILMATFAFAVLSLRHRMAIEIMMLFLAFFWAFLLVKLLPLKNRWWE